MCVTPEQFRAIRQRLHGNPQWNKVPVSKSDLYTWNASSTYIQNPPYFEGSPRSPRPPSPSRARVPRLRRRQRHHRPHLPRRRHRRELEPAGEYLKTLGIRKPSDFNSYGSRRGNDRVMTRGTFANVRVKNNLAKDADPARSRKAAGPRT
jgi:aconitate hydratase